MYHHLGNRNTPSAPIQCSVSIPSRALSAQAIAAIALIMCGIGHFFAISIKIGTAFSHAYPHNDRIIFLFVFISLLRCVARLVYSLVCSRRRHRRHCHRRRFVRLSSGRFA